jgi:hypothetical protein
MRAPSGRGWLLLVAVVVVSGLIVLAGSGRPADSPEHRSDSDGANGTSALYQYAQAQGHPAHRLQSAIRPRPGAGLVFVFTPTTDVTADDISLLRSWLEQGGVLVYADEAGDGGLDREFKLARSHGQAIGRGHGVTALLPGVSTVSGGITVVPFDPSPDQVVLLRGERGEALAVAQAVGRGRLVALADPLEVTNAHIDQDDNWRLAADLLAMASNEAAVEFDEYHHGGATASASPYSVFQFGWAQGLLAAAAVLFFGLALRGRAFGPRLPLSPDTGRPAEEYVSAVGTLLKRARARRLTLEVLAAATRRYVALRVGLARGGPAADQALERRAPDLAARLAAIEADLGRSVASDAGLADAARRLHELAQPMPGGHA